jgi:hypothetical protein
MSSINDSVELQGNFDNDENGFDSERDSETWKAAETFVLFMLECEAKALKNPEDEPAGYRAFRKEKRHLLENARDFYEEFEKEYFEDLAIRKAKRAIVSKIRGDYLSRTLREGVDPCDGCPIPGLDDTEYEDSYCRGCPVIEEIHFKAEIIEMQRT